MNINWSTITPIIFAMLVQTGGAVWWAGSVQTTVSQLADEIAEVKLDVSAEQLRQWARINTNEDNLNKISGSVNTTRAIVERVEGDIKILRGEQQSTNQLLREIVIDGRDD